LKVKIVIFYLYSDVGSTEKNWKEHRFYEIQFVHQKRQIICEEIPRKTKGKAFYFGPKF
jgi:hypothetical protein